MLGRRGSRSRRAFAAMGVSLTVMVPALPAVAQEAPTDPPPSSDGAAPTDTTDATTTTTTVVAPPESPPVTEPPAAAALEIAPPATAPPETAPPAPAVEIVEVVAAVELDGTPLPLGGCTVTGVVRTGSNGVDILCLERVLAGLGYQFAGPDGVMEPAVVNSVKDFQRRNRLRADGIVGQATALKLRIWPGAPAAPAPAAALPESYQATALPLGGCLVSGNVGVASNPVDILCLERVLAGLGYQFLGPDGVMEPAVVNSVKHWQRGHGIRATGTVDATTGWSLQVWPTAPPVAAAASVALETGASGLPANSGSGRRVVYSRGQQRIWAVEADGTVVKTHRVSGRLREPYAGTYSVFSRSMYTYSTDDPTVKWRYMVRFARGPGGGNIGFHEIPTRHGARLQTDGQLGQPLSGGCVRQSTGDAQWMWDWAGVGTKVVVL